MRHLLHFGLFALVLAATTGAKADDDRDDRRKVVVTRDYGPRFTYTARAEVPPARVMVDSRRTFYTPPRAVYKLRRDYIDQRQDLDQIRRIARRWERAMAYQNYPAVRVVDGRLEAWLDREIYESMREPHNHGYSIRIRVLGDELAFLERRATRGHSRGHGHGHGHYGGKHGYKHGRGHYKDTAYSYGRGHAGFYYAEKARILDELVRLSERQVRRAKARLDRPVRLSFAYQ